MSIELISLDSVREIARIYGYWAVFFGIALENTGIPLPGETITLVGGFLAGSGELKYWFVLSSAIGGAVLGDNFGYWIGKVVGWSFLLRIGGWLRISEKQLQGVREQFSKNAPRAVFFWSLCGAAANICGSNGRYCSDDIPAILFVQLGRGNPVGIGDSYFVLFSWAAGAPRAISQLGNSI